jgi:hypothetical protein
MPASQKMGSFFSKFFKTSQDRAAAEQGSPFLVDGAVSLSEFISYTKIFIP